MHHKYLLCVHFVGILSQKIFSIRFFDHQTQFVNPHFLNKIKIMICEIWVWKCVLVVSVKNIIEIIVNYSCKNVGYFSILSSNVISNLHDNVQTLKSKFELKIRIINIKWYDITKIGWYLDIFSQQQISYVKKGLRSS